MMVAATITTTITSTITTTENLLQTRTISTRVFTVFTSFIINEKMYKRIFGIKDDDDFDEIFKTDVLNASPPQTRNTNIKPNENAVQKYNAHFANYFPSSDSAVEMESQINHSSMLTPIPLSNSSMLTPTLLSNDVMNENVEIPNSSFRQLINQDDDNLFPPTQEMVFSQFSPISPMNITSARYDNQSNNLLSTNSSLAEQIETPSLSKISFYSLMQRSLMGEIVEGPSSVQPMIVTQENDSVSRWEPVFSPFSGARQEPPNNISQIFSQDSFFNDNTSQQHDDTHQQSVQQYSNIMSLESLFGSYKPPSNIMENVTSLPVSIIKLYAQIKNFGFSDWTFVHALAAQTCQEFLPMKSNTTLKKSLLLSIASIDTKLDTAPIPIVAIGRDCSSVYSIMNHIGNYAQRFLAPTDQLFNVSVNAERDVEIGPIFLAFGGVCYLGEWSRLAKPFTDEVKIIIDSGKYFINQTNENVELHTAIWTCWSLTGKHNKDYSNVDALVKYFGIPIVMETDEADDAMIEFLLDEAMNRTVEIPEDVLNIRYEDMKSFLNIIRNIELKKSDDAQKLLKFYSDTIKIDRRGALSVKGFQIVQQMSESFAKLSMRHEVLVCDVVAAISMAEETFYFTVGVSTTPWLHSPPPRLQPTQDIEKVEQFFKQFQTWLQNYVVKSN